MKNNIRLFLFAAFLFPVLSAFSQKYRTMQDTIKLNKEYLTVRNDIAALNGKLTIAQNNLPGYRSKAKDANIDAKDAASASSIQASKATNGSVSDAKTSKRKADKAYSEAKDSRSAQSNVSDQENKITRYQLDLKKKQQRLEELDVMRAAIISKYPPAILP